MDPKEKMENIESTLDDISKGTKKSLESINGLTDNVNSLNEKVINFETAIAESDAKSAASAKQLEDMATVIEGQGEKMTGLRKLLNHKHGESGADDYLNIFGKWLKGVYHLKREGSVPDQYKIDGYDFAEKAATTQDDGNAGFLIPDILYPELVAMEDIYGELLPLVRSIPVSPGTTLKINQQATKAAASWRCAECTEIPETAILLNQLTLDPCLLGGIIPVSQELFQIGRAHV